MLILLVSLVTSSLITSARADYVINITQGNIAVEVTGDFVQGLPVSSVNTTSGFARIPVFQGSLEGGNASLLVRLLDDALRAKGYSARVADVKFNDNSNGTLMHYQLGFRVTGASGTRDGAERVDLSWRTFAVGGDFGIGSVSINRIVPNYVQSGILFQVESTGGPTGIQIVKNWYLNAHGTPEARVPFETGNLALFNFSSLSQPLQNWDSQQDSSHSRLSLQSQSGFNVTCLIHLTEGETTTTSIINAVNSVKATIEVPFPSHIMDDELIFETQGGWTPQLMLGLMSAALAVLVTTYAVERHLRPQVRFRRPKKAGR